MKTWRIASLVSGHIVTLFILFVFAFPFREPGFFFSLEELILFFLPLIVVVGILPTRLRLAHYPFSKWLLLCGLLVLGLSIFGRMAWIFPALLLLALLGMFVASQALTKIESRT